MLCLTREELRGSQEEAETSEEIRARVAAACKVQLARGGVPNAALVGRKLRATCALRGDAEALFSRAIDRMGLSGRAHDRVLRVACTNADLAGEEEIATQHVAEALNYRRAVAVDH